MHGFYFSNEIPTIDRILPIVNDGSKFINFKRMYELKGTKDLNLTNEKETAVSEKEFVLSCDISLGSLHLISTAI
jgi:hypothetical protein